MSEKNFDLATALVELKPIFNPDDLEFGAETSEVKAPTLTNLKEALNGKGVKTKDYLHSNSGIKFVIQAMSSDGYNALRSVGQYTPTGYKTSTLKDDMRQEDIIYLVYGVAEPKLTPQLAGEILSKGNWGPSNIGLISAIKELNPAPEQRVDNFIILMAFSRYIAILLKVFKETGALKELAEDLSLKDSVTDSIEYCADLFAAFFAVEESARAWGIPLDQAALMKAKAIRKARGEELGEELENVPDIESLEKSSNPEPEIPAVTYNVVS